MKIWIACSLLLMANFSYAAPEGFPPACNAVPVQGETVTLNTMHPVIVLINNLSTTDIWVTHPVSKPSASAGWSSRLEAGKWSALVVTKKKFELSCIESSPGHEQQIPCENTIAVCSWAAVKLPATANNTFWAAENMPLSALMAALGGKGFTIPAAETQQAQ